jgi:hypothetical protein
MTSTMMAQIMMIDTIAKKCLDVTEIVSPLQKSMAQYRMSADAP